MLYSLNGNDWKLTGWIKNAWRMAFMFETGMVSVPAFGPIPATVPGAVQKDLLNAGFIEDWNIALNSLKCEWVENRDWVYEREFSVPPECKDDFLVLKFDGLDYSGTIRLNGKDVATFEGMHKRFEVDISDVCNRNGSNKLQVIFDQPPEVDGQAGFTSRGGKLKSRFNYTWDWCPRVVNIGIWREVYLQCWNKLRITDFYPRAVYENGNAYIDLNVTCDVAAAGEYTIDCLLEKDQQCKAKVCFTQSLPCGKGQIFTHRIEVESPELWWPNGSGAQPLYRLRIEIKADGTVCETAEKRVGFRSLCFAKNIETTMALPYTPVVNGKRLFIKGVNWVPLSPFYGTVTREDYVKYLSIFKTMNVNLLRVWGGAILENADFYDVCDELGFMVWQEFPQSSSGIDNVVCDDYEFIDHLEEVAKEYILMRRHHVSHSVWCGGNELLSDAAVPNDLRSNNLARLDKLVKQLDPGKYFFPASPTGNFFNFSEANVGRDFNHDVHGPWDYQGDVTHYHWADIEDSQLTSEVGAPGMPRFETLEKMSGWMPLWPPDQSNQLYLHRAPWWIRLNEMKARFGDFTEQQFEEYVRCTRYLQAESLGYSVQAARRAAPLRSGIIVWMANEPVDNTSNTSVIEYDSTAKPAFYRLQSAYASFDVSAVYPRIAYKTGETFSAKIVAVSEETAVADITAELIDLKGRVLRQVVFKNQMVDGKVELGEISCQLYDIEHGVFLLRTTARNGAELISKTDYTFTVDGAYSFSPLRSLPKATLAIDNADGVYHVTNTAETAAIGVFVYFKTADGTVNADRGYFNLLPGETVCVNPISPCKANLVTEGMNL